MKQSAYVLFFYGPPPGTSPQPKGDEYEQVLIGDIIGYGPDGDIWVPNIPWVKEGRYYLDELQRQGFIV